LATIVWTELAVSNLESIFDYISQDSATYASLVVQRIVESVRLLENYPKSGRIVPELGEEKTRELIHDNYRIVYQLGSDRAEILTIHHCSRYFDPNMLVDR
jgi:toxin ParE1/3/4